MEEIVQQLSDLVICDIEDVAGYSGNTWNPGELGWIKVNVLNSTGFPLRDVTLILVVIGAAHVDPWSFFGPALDHEWHWPEIPAGQTQSAYVPVRADEHSDCIACNVVYATASITAEVALPMLDKEEGKVVAFVN